MPSLYIDTHCHLASPRFDSDRDDVASRCRAAGVGMLTVGGDVASSRLSLDMALRHPGVRAAVGVHPCDIDGLTEEGWQEIVEMAGNQEVAAIGETGLDYYWKDTSPDDQKKWFDRHIELALVTGKPLSVHARDSVKDVLATLGPRMGDGLKAIWHCFVAGKKEIGPALDFAVANGIYLAVGGMATFEDQKPLRNHVPLIPDELLLLETDSPYIIPRPKTRDRNEPDGVIRVAEALAELRKTTPERVAEITTRNAVSLLGF